METQDWEVLEQLTGQLDPEMFRRVWSRVMPPERDSPIAVDAPAPAQPDEPPAPPAEEEAVMAQLCRLARQCEQGYRTLARRGMGQQASALAMQCRRAGRRLETMWYVRTGRSRDEHGGERTAEKTSLRELLRQQYSREMRWEQLCRQLLRQGDSADLGLLAGELTREGLRRAAAVRQMLERIAG